MLLKAKLHSSLSEIISLEPNCITKAQIPDLNRRIEREGVCICRHAKSIAKEAIHFCANTVEQYQMSTRILGQVSRTCL